MPTTKTKTPPPTKADLAALDAQRVVHDREDAVWLTTLLLAPAEKGDPHARRWLSRLYRQLRAMGATPVRTWEPAWAPERRAGFGL